MAAFLSLPFARTKGIGLRWAGVIWLYSLVTFVPLDLFKFAIRYVLSGRAWNNLLQNKVLYLHWRRRPLRCWFHFFSSAHACFCVVSLQTAFTTKKNYGREEREAQWATTQRSLHGLPAPLHAADHSLESGSRAELSEIAEQASWRAEVARFREQSTLRGVDINEAAVLLHVKTARHGRPGVASSYSLRIFRSGTPSARPRLYCSLC